jgi:polyhydroxyalkanoate synthesis regulator phasin
MVDKDNWEENKDEAKELAQEFIYDEKRKSECIKYFISHFKISQATAYRWYDKIYNELSIPSIDKANKLAEFKAQVEYQIETSMKDIEKLPVNEKIKLFSEITKLKKELRKL